MFVTDTLSDHGPMTYGQKTETLQQEQVWRGDGAATEQEFGVIKTEDVEEQKPPAIECCYR